MSFIDSTYFTGTLSLPATRESSGKTGSEAILEKIKNRELNAYIEIYEREYLELMFGKKLTDAFYSGINMPDGYPEKEKWTVLKSIFCVEREFSKESPIANYVYRFYLLRLRDNTTNTGTKKSKSTYADNVSDTRKLVNTWNEMVVMNTKIMKWFLNDYFYLYSEYFNDHIPDVDLFTEINGMNI